MLLTTNTTRIGYLFGDIKAIELIKEAGFDSIDANLDYWDDAGYYQGDYIARAKEMRKKADELEIPFTQAHAPFNLPLIDGDEESNIKNTFDVTVKALQCCEILGVDIMVVHPLQFRPYYKNKEFFKELNLKFYTDLIPHCKKYGVKIACENMWQNDHNNGHIIDSVCADPEEFNEYIDMVGSEYLVACLDLGHCGLANRDAAYCIRKMGGDRIKALHIHDNDFVHDKHTIPMLGKMDWDSITKALADINYSGNFTLETGGFLSNFGPYEEIHLQALKLKAAVSRKLMSDIENYKNG